MNGARIFVLHKKDLIRIGILSLVGIVLVITALVFLLSSGGEDETAVTRFNPGTYSSKIILNDEPLHVRVTVSENEILSIYMTDMEETQRVFYPVFEPEMQNLAEEILRYQSAQIKLQTDYPVTNAILQEAVRTALEMAYTEGYASASSTFSD
jgi:uncharacterized protein with FMN-binding domain